MCTMIWAMIWVVMGTHTLCYCVHYYEMFVSVLQEKNNEILGYNNEVSDDQWPPATTSNQL